MLLQLIIDNILFGIRNAIEVSTTRSFQETI